MGGVGAVLARNTGRGVRVAATGGNKIVQEGGKDRIGDGAGVKAGGNAADRALAGKGRAKAVVIVVGLVLILLAGAALVLSGRAPLKIP